MRSLTLEVPFSKQILRLNIILCTRLEITFYNYYAQVPHLFCDEEKFTGIYDSILAIAIVFNFSRLCKSSVNPDSSSFSTVSCHDQGHFPQFKQSQSSFSLNRSFCQFALRFRFRVTFFAEFILL